MPDKVHTHDFILKWADKKNILLPAIKSDILELKVFPDEESLVVGSGMGIPEPVGQVVENLVEIDLIIVPWVIRLSLPSSWPGKSIL